jgi:hypothetical protein
MLVPMEPAPEPEMALEPEPATEPAPEPESAPMALEPAPEPAVATGKMLCPGCGKALRIRTLAEKHTCARKPRKAWKMDPERLLARRRAAAERRFLARRGGEAAEIRGG